MVPVITSLFSVGAVLSRVRSLWSQHGPQSRASSNALIIAVSVFLAIGGYIIGMNIHDARIRREVTDLSTAKGAAESSAALANAWEGAADKAIKSLTEAETQKILDDEQIEKLAKEKADAIATLEDPDAIIVPASSDWLRPGKNGVREHRPAIRGAIVSGHR